ncbi:MAG: YkgJ family cysteine cluster protein [Cyanobacteria bacterium SZAS LIN-3]|nr:YkgJ family cysteine cluster protein [Cyanobacteria bacterium SZAS LIN-3]MBS2010588.1 YkgJ family cysteine cluster protein [Cyanobacteria bacterium SZAS TMP-1]
MDCRRDCGACCIAISISSPLPGLPNGKPAGVRCIHLNERNLCSLFGSPERPAICGSFKPNLDTCGSSRAEAYQLIVRMEEETSPRSSSGR